jgi:hypothetical protein
MPVTRSGEEGFTMVITVIGASLVAMLVLVAVTAVNGDSHSGAYDFKQKQAGIDDYAYHLHANNSYWTTCNNVTPPSAVNQVGSTEKRRPVPGTTGAEYAIELLPSTTQTTYQKCDEQHPTESMIQSKDPLKGTFRIRSTGFAGKAKASIVATFKPGSFLDYVYFTQRETSDPATYGEETLVKAAEKQCSKTIKEERYASEILSGKGYCDTISFVSGDFINGPMHTNDAFVICGSPTLGGSAADPVEVSGPPKGWFSTWEIPNSNSNCSGSNENFKGTFTANSAVLTPPPSNQELSNIAEQKFHFKGQVRICLSGKNMMVLTYSETSTCSVPVGTPLYNGAIPPNGVVYVENGTCSTKYSPFNVAYDVNLETSGCGDAFIEGTYSGQLTIATYNNIVVTGNLCMESCESELPLKGEGVLGLVANNFVRIFHPVPYKTEIKEGKEVKVFECKNGTGILQNVTIDAAILAIEHSFIVDNYKCGAKLGTLRVNGAIAQKYRGAVGTTGSKGSGYLKSYNYDSRLRYLEPPSFIQPEKTAWVIGRETLE